MLNGLIILLALVLLLVHLFFAKRGRLTPELLSKTLLSCLFVFTVIVQDHPIPRYYYFLAAGLILCLAGDVCLALPGPETFRAGLTAFLLGHIFYVLAFTGLTGLDYWFTPETLIFWAVAILIYIRLRPFLGAMFLPVLLYMVAITCMITGAWAGLTNPGLSLPGAIPVFVGATLFFLSDLFVARDRFVCRSFVNRALGLPLYYTGQFMLAFSVGLVG